MRQNFCWPQMRSDNEDMLFTCELWKKAKARYIAVPGKTLQFPDRKFHKVSVDVHGENELSTQHGSRVVLTVMDRLSNFAQLYPLKYKK